MRCSKTMHLKSSHLEDNATILFLQFLSEILMQDARQLLIETEKQAN